MLETIKAHLVEDWKKAYTFLSVQLAALLVLLEISFEYLPVIKEYLPEGWVKYIAIAIIVGRVIAQKKVTK